MLADAPRPRVLLGRDVSCETYAEAVACADLLGARLDILSPRAWTARVLAVQERGIATATLGEIRNRADVVVFWGVDPADRYPRYETRYVPAPIGTHVPDGRRSRTVIAVDIDTARGPADADVRVHVTRSAEVDTLVALAALLHEGQGATHAQAPLLTGDNPAASTLADLLRRGRYAALVADVESDDTGDHGRIHRLLALGHALNVSSRGAVSLLGSGGNLAGADAVMTRQTGYPAAVDFASGVPRYRPHDAALHADGDVTLVVGATAPPVLHGALLPSDSSAIVIGPGASRGAFSRARVVIDSAIAGIHSGGTAVRMDDVPLPLRPLVPGPPDATILCRDLLRRLQARRARA
jgi:formylmethanofuran dehydrogenase subunit B